MPLSVRLALLAAVGLAICALIALFLYTLRLTPVERERRRRVRLNVLGRMHDGMLMEAEGGILQYCYSVNGVDYNASQDITSLPHLVPPEASLIIGPVTLKYMVRNPANSILIAETWSGLRIRPPKPILYEKEPVPNDDSQS